MVGNISQNFVSVWKRTNVILGESEVTVSWEIPDNVQGGVYRLGHRGYWHTIIRGNIYYEGWSEPFTVETTTDHERVPAQAVQQDSERTPHFSSSGNSLQNPFKVLTRWL